MTISGRRATLVFSRYRTELLIITTLRRHVSMHNTLIRHERVVGARRTKRARMTNGQSRRLLSWICAQRIQVKQWHASPSTQSTYCRKHITVFRNILTYSQIFQLPKYTFYVYCISITDTRNTACLTLQHGSNHRKVVSSVRSKRTILTYRCTLVRKFAFCKHFRWRTEK